MKNNIKTTVVREWRPEECHTRLADIVVDAGGTKYVKIKCRRCSKANGVDSYHMQEITPRPI